MIPSSHSETISLGWRINKDRYGCESTPHEVQSEKELKWSAIVIWNNIKYFLNKASVFTPSYPLSSRSKPGVHQKDSEEPASGHEQKGSLSNISEEGISNVPWADPSDNSGHLRDKFKVLLSTFKPISDVNPYLLHCNINKINTKFNDFLNETIQIQLLKFLPLQHFVVINNSERMKIVQKYNFKDQSCEEDFVDVSRSR